MGDVVIGLVLMALGVFHVWARNGLSEAYAKSFYRWIGLGSVRTTVLLGVAFFGVGLTMVLSAVFR